MRDEQLKHGHLWFSDLTRCNLRSLSGSLPNCSTNPGKTFCLIHSSFIPFTFPTPRGPVPLAASLVEYSINSGSLPFRYVCSASGNRCCTGVSEVEEGSTGKGGGEDGVTIGGAIPYFARQDIEHRTIVIWWLKQNCGALCFQILIELPDLRPQSNNAVMQCYSSATSSSEPDERHHSSRNTTPLS